VWEINQKIAPTSNVILPLDESESSITNRFTVQKMRVGFRALQIWLIAEGILLADLPWEQNGRSCQFPVDGGPNELHLGADAGTTTEKVGYCMGNYQENSSCKAELVCFLDWFLTLNEENCHFFSLQEDKKK
jgi:hypothetical protein